MPRGYIASGTSVHFMNYHFVWCSKYRKRVLVGKVKERLEGLIREKAGELGCEVLALVIGMDYVHLFLQSDPRAAPNSIVGQIKGYTSRVLRQEFRELRTQLPTLWTRSYFVSTHGHVSDKLIRGYIEEQAGI